MRFNKSLSLIALSAACLLASCATAYQPDGVSGGYSDQRLGANSVRVSFRGNGMTPTETLNSFLMRRCAEVTLQNGYSYFVLVSTQLPQPENDQVYGTKIETATIEMYQGNKPDGDPHAYDAATLMRALLAQQGESEEPTPPPGVAITNEIIPPQVAKTVQPPVGVADAKVASSSTSHLSANPNALTNQTTLFDQW